MSLHGVLETAFWAATAAVLYVWVGYPVLLGVWAALHQRGTRNAEGGTAEGGTAEGGTAEGRLKPASTYPPVSIVMAARNEAARLPARIANLLALDYPAERQIIVVSDGSTDGTLQVLAGMGDRVEAVAVPAGGKSLALNAGVARARHPILVFADARQQFASDALRCLVARFSDPSVGAVSGELVLEGEITRRDKRFKDAPEELKDRRAAERRARRRAGRDRRGHALGRSGSTVAGGTSAYWRYEKWLRRREAMVGSMLGVTGAIAAMRRDLWQPLPADTLLDDVLAPMRLVLAGFRVVFEERALAYDVAAPDTHAEWRRKVRTLAGNYQVLGQEPRLLVPWHNPVWLQYVSHKVGRLAVPWALLVAFVSSAALSAESPWYAAACVAQASFYALAAYGARLEASARAGRPTPTAASVRAAFRTVEPKGQVHA